MGDTAGQAGHGTAADGLPAHVHVAADGLTTDARNPVGYIQGLDGLRGLAVTFVTLYHGSHWARGGFLGVDVFFPLSGFLITSLLMTERVRSGRISLKYFYARRALRLLPALLAMLLAYLLLAAWLDGDKLWRHVVDAGSTLLYAANIPRAMHIGRPVYLAPCWSLSLEEHFYLLWAPLMVWLSARKVSPRRLAAYLTLAALLAGAYRVALLQGGASHQRLYYLLDTRADSFLFGAALGVLHGAGALPQVNHKTLRRALEGGAWLAVSSWFALLLHAHYSHEANYSWRFSYMALSTCVLVFYLVRVPEGLLQRLLSARPLTALGRVSYGVYLWHYPIFYALAHDAHWPLPKVLAVGGPLSVLIAAASYRWLELPALRLKARLH